MRISALKNNLEYTERPCSSVAVEHILGKDGVAGSTPAEGSRIEKAKGD